MSDNRGIFRMLDAEYITVAAPDLKRLKGNGAETSADLLEHGGR